MVTILISRDDMLRRVGRAIVAGPNRPEYIDTLQEFLECVEKNGTPTVYMSEYSFTEVSTETRIAESEDHFFVCFVRK